TRGSPAAVVLQHRPRLSESGDGRGAGRRSAQALGNLYRPALRATAAAAACGLFNVRYASDSDQIPRRSEMSLSAQEPTSATTCPDVRSVQEATSLPPSHRLKSGIT